MKRLQFHPACLLFPQLGKEELQELADDIGVRGLLHDIVLYDGQILDGRNRYLACSIAGVKPRFVEWTGKGSPIEWVISENLIRRHLTSSQRAVIALDILPLLEKEAKERQREGGRVAKTCATLTGTGKASEFAAKLTHANPRYVEMCKAVGKEAPDLLDAIRSGHLGVPDAVKLGKMPTQERRKMLRKLQAGGIAARAIVGDSDHRRERDRYFTQLREIDSLLAVEEFPGKTLDPCKGDGRIVRRMRQKGYSATGTDIDEGVDFFATVTMADNIVTNPPWDDKDRFILHAMKRGKIEDRPLAPALCPIWNKSAGEDLQQRIPFFVCLRYFSQAAIQ